MPIRGHKFRGRMRLGADGGAEPHGVEVSEMSAPNPNPGEREFDAMRRAQRAHEPSMEEILASIRAIIADDREADSPRTPSRVSNPELRDAARIAGIESPPARTEIPSPRDDATAQKPASALQHAEPSVTAPAERESPPVISISPVEIEAEITPVPEPEIETAPLSAELSDAPLLSEDADQAVAASFEALSSSVALHNSELVESLTREMVRPMIKAWLDENLPSLVERLVRAEIQRVARGGR